MNPGIDSVEVVRVAMRLLYPLSTGENGIIKSLFLKMARGSHYGWREAGVRPSKITGVSPPLTTRNGPSHGAGWVASLDPSLTVSHKPAPSTVPAP
jgi:hypothetical protein